MNELPQNNDGGRDGDRDGTSGDTAPKLIVVGGGPGGTGKTLLASSIGICLAHLGRRVVLVDADLAGSGIASAFGVSAKNEIEARASENDLGASETFATVPAPIDGLSLGLLVEDRTRVPLALRGARPARYIARLSRLPYDYVVVDAGAGESAMTLELMLAAHAPVLVTSPEPRSIACVSRFLRAAYLRRVQREIGRDPLGKPAILRVLASTGPLPSRLVLCAELAKIDRRLAELAGSLHWSPITIVNHVRVRLDTEIGPSMRVLFERHYGLSLRAMGHVEFDEAVVQSARKRAPLLLDNPTAKASRNVERAVRRITGVEGAMRDEYAVPEPYATSDNHYELLAIDRGASDEEIRRATKRQRELYGPESMAAISLLDESTLVRERARIEEATSTLLDPARRKTYDGVQFPAPPEDTTALAPQVSRADANIVNALMEELGPDVVVTGALLRRVREACGIDLSEISARTKVSRIHLEALEEENFAKLPPPVYVRGIVIEFAKALRLDPAHAERSYMARLRERTA